MSGFNTANTSSLERECDSSQQADSFIRGEEATRTIVETLVHRVAHSFSKGLKAVVLAGSVARGEGTFVRAVGGLRLLGDADFLLVYEAGIKPPDSEALQALVREAESSLAVRGLSASVHADTVSPSYFRRLPRAIFTFELRTCGRVIWGDREVLGLIPAFSSAEIRREDAWHMLSNRMIELLEASRLLAADAEELRPEMHYATVKLYLDMATSYLVFAGHYAPSYRERSELLLALAADPAIEAPFPLKEFAVRVADCTAWKLSGDEARGRRSSEFWMEAIHYLAALWRWEMMQLTASRSDVSVAVLCDRLAAQQSIVQRLRGWMSVVKRRGLLKNWRSWPRWARLAFLGTPRYLVYRVGAELAFRIPKLLQGAEPDSAVDANLAQLSTFLPEQAPADGPSAQDVPLWRTLANGVHWNYSQLLIGTRA